MAPWYRLLGLVAGLNRALRGYYYPMILAVLLIGLLLGIAGFYDAAYVGFRNDQTPWWAVGGTVLCAAALALLVHSLLRHNIVFRPEAPAPTAAALSMPPPGIDVRVSGRFTHDIGRSPWVDFFMYGIPRSRWFVDEPAEFVVLGSSAFAFAVQLDFSLWLSGVIPLHHRAGTWRLTVKRDTLQEPEWGWLYLGLAARPALRLRFRDAGDVRRTAVLSFADPASRHAFFTRLKGATDSAAGISTPAMPTERIVGWGLQR